MRHRHHRLFGAPALTAAALAMVGAVVSFGSTSAAPPDDPPAEALARFEEFAAAEGYTLVDPVCVESSDQELIFVCYGLTESGGPLIAQTDVSGDVVDWEVLQRPDEAAAGPAIDSVPDATVEPNAEPAVVEPAVFNPLGFFADLYSADPAKVQLAAASTMPLSPAEAYVAFQAGYLTSLTGAGATVDRSYVYQTPDSIRVCVTGDDCFEITDLEVVDEKLVGFSIDGFDVAGRLGQPGLPVILGAAAARLAVAYQPVSTGGLVAFVEVVSTNDEVFELSTAVYVEPDGSVTPVNPEVSPGAVDTTVKGAATAMLVFPDSAPGGEIRFLVHPSDGSTPSTAIVPVPLFAAG